MNAQQLKNSILQEALAEQKRIVAKIEEVFAEIDKLKK
jgi:vacuolar-type H+-ATPase subunit E/Vma4